MVGCEEFHDSDEWNDKEDGGGFFVGVLVSAAVLFVFIWLVISWNH